MYVTLSPERSCLSWLSGRAERPFLRSLLDPDRIGHIWVTMLWLVHSFKSRVDSSLGDVEEIIVAGIEIRMVGQQV